MALGKAPGAALQSGVRVNPPDGVERIRRGGSRTAKSPGSAEDSDARKKGADMGNALKRLFKLGALIGAVVALAKGAKLFSGNPAGVGGEGFSFDEEGDDPYAVDESKLGGEVSTALLERLVCPLDKGPLTLVDKQWLLNPRNGYRYPIVDGIPVMLVEVGERYRQGAGATPSAAVPPPA